MVKYLHHLQVQVPSKCKFSSCLLFAAASQSIQPPPLPLEMLGFYRLCLFKAGTGPGPQRKAAGRPAARPATGVTRPGTRTRSDLPVSESQELTCSQESSSTTGCTVIDSLQCESRAESVGRVRVRDGDGPRCHGNQIDIPIFPYPGPATVAVPTVRWQPEHSGPPPPPGHSGCCTVTVVRP